jgi:hypothetical protein
MFFGRVDIKSGHNDGFTVGGVAGTIPAGAYYMYSPTAAESLLDTLIDALDDYDPGTTWDWAITSDGLLTLTPGSSSSLNGLEIYADLGYASADLGTDTTFEAPKFLKWCWFPGQGPADSLAPTSNAGRLRAFAIQAIGCDQDVYTTKIGQIAEQQLTFKYLSKAKTWDENSDNRSYEEFWHYVVSSGCPMLFMPEYPTATPRHVYKAALGGGAGKMMVRRQTPGSDTYWEVTVPLFGAE